MLQQIGICIIVWLTVGLIAGLKLIYIDRRHTPERVEKAMRRYEKENGREMSDDEQRVFEFIFKSNFTLLAILTLLGFFSFYFDTVRTFKKRRK